MPLCMHTRDGTPTPAIFLSGALFMPRHVTVRSRLAVVDNSGVHVFSLPCCRILGYWCDTQKKGRLRLNLPIGASSSARRR